jgi:hypothetical protein
MLVFSTELCVLLPLSPCLWFNSPHPPFPVKISILYARIQCKGGGKGSWPQTDKYLPQSPVL